jgi:hypothetical protein
VTFVGQTSSNSPPVLTPLANQTMNAGTVITLTNVATDPNVPPQKLSFNLLTAPPGAALNSSNGVFSWRAPVGYSNTTNPVAVTVADNATQPLSATNNFTIRVNPITNAVVGGVIFDGTQLTLTVTGPPGPDYTLQTTTNLFSDWQTRFSTNSPPIPFSLTDTNFTDPARFYRWLIGP